MPNEIISHLEILAKLQQDSDRQNKEFDASREIDRQRDVALKLAMQSMVQSLNAPLYALINDIKYQRNN